nr:unnamed protein product [Callosobruchus analis]
MHEYGSNTSNNTEKADHFSVRRDSKNEGKKYRSRDHEKKTTERKYKNRTYSPNNEGKSNYDNNSGNSNRKYEVETCRSISHNTEEKFDAEDNYYRSNNRQGLSHNRSEYERNVSSMATKTTEENTRSDDYRDSRDKPRGYDLARSDNHNSKKDDFSEDPEWQQPRGRNRGAQNHRKTQPNRSDKSSYGSLYPHKASNRPSQVYKSGSNNTKKQNQEPVPEKKLDNEVELISHSQNYKNVHSSYDKPKPDPEYKKGSEDVAMAHRSSEYSSFDINDSIDSDSSYIRNWRNTRQSLDSCGRDEKHKEIPQRRSLGDERRPQKWRDPRMERGSANWRNDSKTDDPEYEDFLEMERRREEMNYVKVTEKSGDLFEMPKEYSLAHCVAEDLSMGSGIAVHFKRDFKGLAELYDQRQKQGGLAILEKQDGDSKRYIYYLVTKRESSGKPTYFTFWSSVKKMRDHIRENGVKKLAMPRIGCGLDRLEWSRVKDMIEFLFRDVDVEIVVCNFQQDCDTPTKEPGGLYCRVVRKSYHITKLENYSIIIYFSTEDGFIPDEMIALQKRCNFIPKFEQTKKALGEIIRFDDWVNKYILYGCIVRKNVKEPFQFKSFAKCLIEINKQNRKDCFGYVGIPAVRDETDYLLNFKIINIAKTYLRDVDVYHCLDNECSEESSKETENEDSFVSPINTLFEEEGNETASKDNVNADVSGFLNVTKDEWW